MVNVFSARQFDWGAEEVAGAARGEEDDDEAGRKERGVNSIIFIVTDVTEKSPASFFPEKLLQASSILGSENRC